jgi:hypothetical protein
MLVDALIASALLVMGALAYYSLVPVVQRSQKISQQQQTAVYIGNRVIEHLLLLKPSTLTAQNLIALALIDSGQQNPPYSFSKLPLDDGWVYSPSRALPEGEGVMDITDLDDGSKRVQIQISWQGPKQRMTYTTGTVLGAHR